MSDVSNLLYTAVKEANWENAKKLLFVGGIKEQMNFIDHQGYNAIHLACSKDPPFALMKLLVDFSSQENLLALTHNKSNPLFHAIRYSSVQSTIYYIEKCPDAVGQINKWGNTPLHIAVSDASPPDVIELMLKHSVYAIKILNRAGKSPLTIYLDKWTKGVTSALLCDEMKDKNGSDNKFFRNLEVKSQFEEHSMKVESLFKILMLLLHAEVFSSIARVGEDIVFQNLPFPFSSLFSKLNQTAIDKNQTFNVNLQSQTPTTPITGTVISPNTKPITGTVINSNTKPITNTVINPNTKPKTDTVVSPKIKAKNDQDIHSNKRIKTGGENLTNVNSTLKRPPEHPPVRPENRTSYNHVNENIQLKNGSGEKSSNQFLHASVQKEKKMLKPGNIPEENGKKDTTNCIDKNNIENKQDMTANNKPNDKDKKTNEIPPPIRSPNDSSVTPLVPNKKPPPQSSCESTSSLKDDKKKDKTQKLQHDKNTLASKEIGDSTIDYYPLHSNKTRTELLNELNKLSNAIKNIRQEKEDISYELTEAQCDLTQTRRQLDTTKKNEEKLKEDNATLMQKNHMLQQKLHSVIWEKKSNDGRDSSIKPNELKPR